MGDIIAGRQYIYMTPDSKTVFSHCDPFGKKNKLFILFLDVNITKSHLQ